MLPPCNSLQQRCNVISEKRLLLCYHLATLCSKDAMLSPLCQKGWLKNRETRRYCLVAGLLPDFEQMGWPRLPAGISVQCLAMHATGMNLLEAILSAYAKNFVILPLLELASPAINTTMQAHVIQWLCWTPWHDWFNRVLTMNYKVLN